MATGEVFSAGPGGCALAKDSPGLRAGLTFCWVQPRSE